MNPEELKALKVDKVVDARGIACPGPLLAAKRSISSVPMHGVMEVISSDEGSTEGVPLWAKQVGQEYLGTVSGPGLWHIFVRRNR